MDILFDGICGDIATFDELAVVKIVCRIILLCIACDSMACVIGDLVNGVK